MKKNMTNLVEFQSFSLEVENLVAKNKISYVDAVLKVCDDYDLLYEEVPKLLSPSLKQLLMEEGYQSNILKRDYELQITL